MSRPIRSRGALGAGGGGAGGAPLTLTGRVGGLPGGGFGSLISARSTLAAHEETHWNDIVRFIVTGVPPKLEYPLLKQTQNELLTSLGRASFVLFPALVLFRIGDRRSPTQLDLRQSGCAGGGRLHIRICSVSLVCVFDRGTFLSAHDRALSDDATRCSRTDASLLRPGPCLMGPGSHALTHQKGGLYLLNYPMPSQRAAWFGAPHERANQAFWS